MIIVLAQGVALLIIVGLIIHYIFERRDEKKREKEKDYSDY